MKRKEHGTGFDLHALEVFYRVLETGSFSGAARAMGLAQPTVSQHVASLERALSSKLLDRSTKKVRPTPGGRVLRDYARKLLALRDQAAEAVAAADGAVKGVLAVGASTIPGTYVLPEAAARLRRENPNVAVEVEIGDSRSVETMVAEERVELGLTGTAPIDRRVRGAPFLKDELILAVPPSDAWGRGRRKTLDPKNLKERPFVMREPGSGTQATVERALSKLGLPVEELDVVCRLGSTAAVMEAVRRGVGVAWVSRKAAETPLEHGLVASVSVRGIKMERDCYLVLRRGRSVSPTSRAFQEILRETGRGKTGR